jgi:CRP-like cAMP-binding protein
VWEGQAVPPTDCEEEGTTVRRTSPEPPPGALFDACGPRDRRTLTGYGSIVPVPAGHVLCHRNAVAREALVILAGEVVAVDDVSVERLGVGDHIGTHEVAERRTHARTVVAATDLRLEVFSAAEFLALLHDVPAVAARLRQQAVLEPDRGAQATARRAAAKASMSA